VRDVTTSADPWAAYEPDAREPWDRRRVVHLHRRAGFAATWDEIERDLKDGPGPSVDRLLEGRSRLAGVPEGFEATAGLIARAAVSTPGAGRLRGWWVYRMLCGPDPLGERLTLMWHDHFATADRKVGDPGAMLAQNETLRRLARAPFGELLRAMTRDPALMVWLDAADNTRAHPNENLARELMELFTLGVGHFTEADVKEAARALTGWRVVDGRGRFVPARHDHSAKAVLGRAGPLDLDGLTDLLLDQPATARRLAWRLCHEFLGESTADPAVIQNLADGLRAHGLDVGWGVATVLRSRAFHGGADLGARVVGPVEFAVGAARALEAFDPPPDTSVLADWAARLGQDLFDPPNVGGWPGGRQWITTRSAIGRANYAAALVGGLDVGRPGPIDLRKLADRHGRADDPAFFARLLLGRDVPAVSARDPDAAVRLLASPEAQRA